MPHRRECYGPDRQQDAGDSDLSDAQGGGPGGPQGGPEQQEGGEQTGRQSLLPVVGVAKPKEPEKKGRPWLRPALIGLAIVALLLGIPWAIGYYHYSSTHVSTDDAYVTGNLINVSPLIAGTLRELNVDEGFIVRRDQLIA